VQLHVLTHSPFDHIFYSLQPNNQQTIHRKSSVYRADYLSKSARNWNHQLSRARSGARQSPDQHSIFLDGVRSGASRSSGRHYRLVRGDPSPLHAPSSTPNLRLERNRACHRMMMRLAGIVVWRGRSCDATGACSSKAFVKSGGCVVPARVGKKYLEMKDGLQAADDIRMAQVAKRGGRETAVKARAASLRPMRRCHLDSIASGSVPGIYSLVMP